MSRNNQPDQIENLTSVLFFLYGAMQDKAIYGGHMADKAFDSFCELMKINKEALLELMQEKLNLE